MSRALSGQVVVTTAGSAVSFTTLTDMKGTYLITPSPANTGSYCYVGNDGSDDVTSQTGTILKKDVNSLVITVSELSELKADSDTTNDIICWIRVMGEIVSYAPPAQ